jgi:hypothetical protein
MMFALLQGTIGIGPAWFGSVLVIRKAAGHSAILGAARGGALPRHQQELRDEARPHCGGDGAAASVRPDVSTASLSSDLLLAWGGGELHIRTRAATAACSGGSQIASRYSLLPDWSVLRFCYARGRGATTLRARLCNRMISHVCLRPVRRAASLSLRAERNDIVAFSLCARLPKLLPQKPRVRASVRESLAAPGRWVLRPRSLQPLARGGGA